MAEPRISFGIIALNTQPFLVYNLRAIYPFAHEIIVVEGAVRTAAALARSDGHSSDGSWEMLLEFQREEDPEGKLVLVSARDDGYPDGFWPEKVEMSQAYARRAGGDWLWQVDADEFYNAEDVRAVLAMLQQDETITAVSFPYYEFFGGFDYRITGQWHKYEQPLVNRLFRWRPGFRYVDHRPPQVVDEMGNNLVDLHWIKSPKNDGNPIHMYHYSYVLPKQAEQKVGYYSGVGWTEAFRDNARWLADKYYGLKDPLFLGERDRKVVQWLQLYHGSHPEAIQQFRADLAAGRLAETVRETGDIEKLLDNPGYRLARLAARLYLFAIWQPWRWLKLRLRAAGGRAKRRTV